MGIVLSNHAQESFVEEIGSTSFEFVRLRAREQVGMFMDYYQIIANKNVNMAEKEYNIQKAVSLFLPGQGEVVMSQMFIRSTNKRQRKLDVKSFLERVARGIYRTATDISSYEFCHVSKQEAISKREIEVTFCKHNGTLRESGNICTMPNGYVKCVMSNADDEVLNRTYLITIYMDFIVHE